MGICWPGCLKKRPRRRIVLILIGLDNAGKTETVNSLVGVGDSVLPTVGFKAVNLVHRDTPVTVYDLGGGPNFRRIWPQYFSEVHGVIFVVDASDYARLDEGRRALEEVVSHERISGKPILILANKQDRRGALDDIDVVEKMGIEPLVNRYRCPTLVESYTAAPEHQSTKRKLDPGLKKGYLWLLNYIVSRYGDINLRVQTDIHAELERRKRQSAMIHAGSETYPDELSTETGFANPNYETLTRARDLEEGVIIVKPIAYASSGENTLKTESRDSSDVTVDDKPKLKPLFGDLTPKTESKDSSDERVNIKPKLNSLFGTLTPKTESLDATVDIKPKLKPLFGALTPKTESGDSSEVTVNDKPKLTPMRANLSAVEKRSLGRDIRSRPQSSPSVQAVEIVTEIEINEIDDTTFTDVDLSDVKDEKHKREEEMVVGEKMTPLSADVTPPARAASDTALRAAAPPGARPASASQLVRRQLEVAGAHRRRLSLRYGYRNKTSPEQLGLFHYEPSSKLERAPGGRRDTGDFEASVRLDYAARHRDAAP